MFGLPSPPLCYPEKLAVAQSAQGSSKENVISVIKRAAFEKLALCLAASLVTEQQLATGTHPVFAPSRRCPPQKPSFRTFIEV